MTPLHIVRRTAAYRAIWRAVRDTRRADAPGVRERLAVVPRMLGASLSGRYDGLSRRRLGLMGLAAAYVASPVDLVPEGLLLVVGLGDDLVVGTWLLGALLEEAERYLRWEQGQHTVVEGEVLNRA